MRKTYLRLALIAGVLVFGGWYLLNTKQAVAPTGDEPLVDKQSTMALQLTSDAFNDGDTIPARYTCDGENVNPPLSVTGVPEGTASLVLVMDDPDIPQEVKDSRGIERFDHWVLYNLSPDTIDIPADAEAGAVGLNTSQEAAYTGPCPPPDHEPHEHRYVFRLYAVSGQLNFIKTPTLQEVEEAAQGMMLEKAELTGRYSRR